MKLKNSIGMLAFTILASTSLVLADNDDKRGKMGVLGAASTQVISTTTIACVQTSLEKRENALIAGHDALNASIKAALTKRLTGLKDAWAQTDKNVRQTKRQTTWNAFKVDSKLAHSNMKTARNNAWKTFDTDMKACGVRGHGEYPQSVKSENSSL